MAEQGRCGSCKWWERNHPAIVAVSRHPDATIAGCFHSKMDDKGLSVVVTLAPQREGPGPTPPLQTRHDFGCVLWEAGA